MGRCECSKRCCVRFLRTHGFTLALILSVAIGIGMGIALRYKYPAWTSREIIYLQFPGELLVRMLKMVMLPLVVVSIINASSNMKARCTGKVAGRMVAYFLSTTLISGLVGIILVASIRPGDRMKKARTTSSNFKPAVDFLLLDLLRNFFPSNIFAAFFQTTTTVLKPPPMPTASPSDIAANITPTQTPSNQWPAAVTTVSGTNSLGLIVFSIAFGVAINVVIDVGFVTRQFFVGAIEALMIIVRVIIWYTPIGVIFILAGKVVAMKNPVAILNQLTVHIATVFGGLAIHTFIILPLIYFIFVRRNPFSYMFGTTKALFIALSTSSSAATLPITLHCAEDINRLDKRIARFVLPIGASINMDGTAMFAAMASAIVAQMNGITLYFGHYIVIWLAAAASSIGAAGVPDVSLGTLVIVLEAAGLPLVDVSLLLTVDWFLDRLRTAVNVFGDTIAAAVVQKLSSDDLVEMSFLDATNFKILSVNNVYQMDDRPKEVQNSTQF